MKTKYSSKSNSFLNTVLDNFNNDKLKGELLKLMNEFTKELNNKNFKYNTLSEYLYENYTHLTDIIVDDMITEDDKYKLIIDLIEYILKEKNSKIDNNGNSFQSFFNEKIKKNIFFIDL